MKITVTKSQHKNELSAYEFNDIVNFLTKNNGKITFSNFMFNIYHRLAFKELTSFQSNKIYNNVNFDFIFDLSDLQKYVFADHMVTLGWKIPEKYLDKEKVYQLALKIPKILSILPKKFANLDLCKHMLDNDLSTIKYMNDYIADMDELIDYALSKYPAMEILKYIPIKYRYDKICIAALMELENLQ